MGRIIRWAVNAALMCARLLSPEEESSGWQAEIVLATITLSASRSWKEGWCTERGFWKQYGFRDTKR